MGPAGSFPPPLPFLPSDRLFAGSPPAFICCCFPYSARLRGSYDGAGGPPHHGPNICQVRTHPRHELCRCSGANRSDAGPRGRRTYSRLPSLANDLLYQSAHRPSRFVFHLPPSAGLSRGTRRSTRHHRTDSVWFWRRPSLLCLRSLWRAHSERPRNAGPAPALRRVAVRLRKVCRRDTSPALAFRLVSHSNLSRCRYRRLHYPIGCRGNAVSSSVAVPGGIGLHARPIRLPDHASSPRGDELEDDDAFRAHALWLSARIDLQHRDHRHRPRVFRHHRSAYAGLAYCAASLQLRLFFLAAIHEYEYSRVCRCW